MEVLYKRCCGIDIHKNMMVACVFTSVRKKEIRQFSTCIPGTHNEASDVFRITTNSLVSPTMA
ncbi:MAG: hypothetical protein SO267_03910 [Lachnospiraceae bacterium]|nr:hypothetical protein [Lachnospiraceae bacterium]